MQPLETNINYSIIVQSTSGRIEASQVNFTVADLKTLSPAVVQSIFGEKRGPLSSFLRDTCRTRSSVKEST